MESGVAISNGNTYTLPSDKPFFLACGIFRPHKPLFAPAELIELFDPDELDLTREKLDAMLADIQDLPPKGLENVTGSNPDYTVTAGGFYSILMHGLTIDPQEGDLRGWREFVRHYLACVAFADRCVGRLLDGLNNGPHAENTLVVLWSDHGWSLGEKYRIAKDANWTEETESVLIIKDPDEFGTAGQLCRQPVSLMDLYRTIHAKCNVPVPEYVGGRDLSYLIRNPEALWDDAPLATLNHSHHTIVENDYRYIRYNESDQELYDQVVDPDDQVNLMLVPGYDDVADEMDTRLAELLAYEPKLTQKYLFEGNTLDSGPDALHGTGFGPIGYDTGAFSGSQAISFDGAGTYVQIPQVITDDFTIAFWVNTNQFYPSSGQHWFHGIGLVDGDVPGSEDDFGISLMNGVVAFGMGNPDTTIFTSTAINDGDWHHIAATRDKASGQIRIYVDGAEEASGLGPLGTRTAASSLNIGTRLSGGDFFSGKIDDLRIFNFKMSQADIVSIIAENELLLGDVNLDGVVNLLDVDSFLERIASGKYQAEADVNQDGSVDLLDVAPFVAIVVGD